MQFLRAKQWVVMLIAAGYLKTRGSACSYVPLPPSLSFSSAEFPSPLPFDGSRRISEFFDPYLGQMILLLQCD